MTAATVTCTVTLLVTTCAGGRVGGMAERHEARLGDS